MESRTTHRREFLQSAAAVAAFSTSANAVLAEGPEPKERPKSPKEALEMLMEGNKRFMAGKTKRMPVTPQELAKLEKGQHPFATILGCSDSRVPTELIFDQGLGDLFVIRLAGNVVDADVEGSLEYAFEHLQTKLLVVLGHEGCGAVTAALAAVADREKEPLGVRKLVKKIEPAVKDLDPKLPMAKRIHLGVEANVRQSVREILSFPGHKEAHEKGKFEILPAVYELHTGRVRVLKM